MRIYWYWPFVHREDLVVPAAVPREGDQLVLHALEGQIDAQGSAHDRLRVEPTLAPLGDETEGSVRWAVARSSSYARRISQRHRVLRREHFDICHIVFLNYFTDWLDLRLLARHRALVFEVHDVFPHQSRVPAAVERRALARQYATPGLLIVRHELVRDRLENEFGVDPARVRVVPWHVPDLGVMPRADYHDANGHAQRTVLFFGAMRRNKGVGILLESIAALRDRADLRFVFAGRGFADVEDAIRDAAARDPRIEFEQGFVPAERKDELYEQADLVVLPYTEFASTSAVLCDAYAHRVPVVVTDVGALGTSVSDDKTGWVVPARDAGALTAAIDRALSDRDSWTTAAAATAEASADRTPAAIGRRIRSLYEDALGARALDA